MGCASANLKCLACNASSSPMSSMDPTDVVCQVLTRLGQLGTPCSANDTETGSFVTAYFFANQSLCSLAPLLESRGVATQLECCNDSLCNHPPALTTALMPSTSMSSGGGGGSGSSAVTCYIGASSFPSLFQLSTQITLVQK